MDGSTDGTWAARIKRAFVWAVTATVIGLVAGFGTVMLAYALVLAAKVMEQGPVFGWLLPLGGLLTIGVYRVLKVPWTVTTNTVVAAARTDAAVAPVVAPAIVFGTTMTNMFGGSAGQEAAVLELGGALGSGIGRWTRTQKGVADVFKEGSSDGTFILCGMAGAFSALLFAPLCSTLFVIELARTHADLRRGLAVLVSALTGYLVADRFMPADSWLDLTPLADVGVMWEACLAVVAVATVAGVLYCLAIRAVRKAAGTLFKDAVSRLVVLGAAIALLVNLGGLLPYTGPGDALMRTALHGEAATWDFVGKLVVTALVIGVGFKGGELTPSMTIGACAGCTVGHFMGVEPGVCAAIGLVAIFSATTNTPVGSFLLGVEAFGLPLAPYFAVAAVLAFLPTIKLSLYECNQIPSYGQLLDAVRQTFGGLPRWQ